MLIAMAGLPASGKSTIARPLTEALGALHLDKDRIRADLFADRVDYSREQNDLCTDVAYRTAIHLLRHDPTAHAVLDGRTYARRYQVEALERAAAEARAPLLVVECVCGEAETRRRLAADAGVHPAADRDVAMYLESRERAEPIGLPTLRVDTERESPEEAVARIVARVRTAAREARDPGTTVVLDIGGTRVRIAHAIGEDVSAPAESLPSEALRVADAGGALGNLVARYCEARALRPDALVLGLPGHLDKAADRLSHCNNLPELEGEGLGAALAARFGCEVLLEQDIELQLLGEWRAGAARGSDRVFALYFGTGIGSAFLVGGDPDRDGAYTPQAGHVPVAQRGTPCLCGNRDCVEAYASGHTLTALAARHALPVERLFVEPAADRALARALDELVTWQAYAIATAVTLLEPERVVVGGGIVAMDGYPLGTLFDRARARMQRPEPGERVVIARAELGENASRHGALALVERRARIVVP